MKKQLKNLLSFIIIFLIINLIFNYFFKSGGNETSKNGQVILAPSHQEFGFGDAVNIDITNNSVNTVTIKNRCPNEPLEIFFKQNNQWVQKSNQATLDCSDTLDIVLKPGDKQTVSFKYWNHALFGELGTYKAKVTLLETPPPPQETQQYSTQTQTQSQTQVQANTAPGEPAIPTIITQILESTEFNVTPQGFIGSIWTSIFYQPIYNVLIFLISITPGHDLGFGIILLTILIRTILLVPSQRALKSQRKMQEIQPKLNKIREKYKDNQEMIGKETLAIMKEYKVNPLGSCLPLLIQFPILIGLYYVVQNGLNADNSYLLYGSLQNFPYSLIHVNFLSILDLTKINHIVLPLIVGGMQFLQMKLAFVRTKKIKDTDKDGEKPQKSQMDTANNMMLYFMPAMIAIFTASVPAGVGLYWSVSTLYGIAQQLVVNYQSDQGKAKVKVL